MGGVASSIFGLIIWIVGGVAVFWLCALVYKMLEPKLGGFSFVVALIVFLAIMMVFSGFIDIPISP